MPGLLGSPWIVAVSLASPLRHWISSGSLILTSLGSGRSAARAGMNGIRVAAARAGKSERRKRGMSSPPDFIPYHEQERSIGPRVIRSKYKPLVEGNHVYFHIRPRIARQCPDNANAHREMDIGLALGSGRIGHCGSAGAGR